MGKNRLGKYNVRVFGSNVSECIDDQPIFWQYVRDELRGSSTAEGVYIGLDSTFLFLFYG